MVPRTRPAAPRSGMKFMNASKLTRRFRRTRPGDGAVLVGRDDTVLPRTVDVPAEGGPVHEPGPQRGVEQVSDDEQFPVEQGAGPAAPSRSSVVLADVPVRGVERFPRRGQAVMLQDLPQFLAHPAIAVVFL